MMRMKMSKCHKSYKKRAERQSGATSHTPFRDAQDFDDVEIALRNRRRREAFEQEDARRIEKATVERSKITLPTLHFMGDKRSTGLEILKQAEELSDDDVVN
jgi:hypothetical protein